MKNQNLLTLVIILSLLILPWQTGVRADAALQPQPVNGTHQDIIPNAGSLFVAVGASGNCTQANPCSLHSALELASTDDSIYLAEGVYTGSGAAVIMIDKPITIFGGWDGAPSGPINRDPVAYPSKLDGEAERRVVFITGSWSVVLDGLNIENGSTTPETAISWNGAGLYSLNANLILRNTNFHDNVADVFDYDGEDAYAYGGGAYVNGGTLFVENSSFQGNSTWAKKNSLGGGLAIINTLTAAVVGTTFLENDAWNAGGAYFEDTGLALLPFSVHNSTFSGNGWGNAAGQGWTGYAGAMLIKGGNVNMEGNLFHNNLATGNYGALAFFYSSLSFNRNIVYDNRGAITSALFLMQLSSCSLTNNIIANNSAPSVVDETTALRVVSTSGSLLHNTFASNHGEFGVLVRDSSNITMVNNILVDHTVAVTVSFNSTVSMEGTLWGSGVWANDTDWDGEGSIGTGTINLWDDPAFVDPVVGDYHLSSESAAIDAGVNTAVLIDIDGDPRPHGEGYDIGADEFGITHIYLPLILR